MNNEMQAKLIIGEMYEIDERAYVLSSSNNNGSLFIRLDYSYGEIDYKEKFMSNIEVCEMMNECKIIHLTSDEHKVKAKAIMTIIGNDS